MNEAESEATEIVVISRDTDEAQSVYVRATIVGAKVRPRDGMSGKWQPDRIEANWRRFRMNDEEWSQWWWTHATASGPIIKAYGVVDKVRHVESEYRMQLSHRDRIQWEKWLDATQPIGEMPKAMDTEDAAVAE